MKKFLIFAVFIAVISGCSAKKGDEIYNLAPQAWFNLIIKDIKDSNLKAADEHYVSFSSEHIGSPLLESMTLILAQAHTMEEDYTLANTYLDEYIRRYGTDDKIQYAKFLKIKSNFDSFNKPNRNQKLVQISIVEIQNFLMQYPDTKYKPLLETMLIKFRLAENELNKSIKNLYEKTGRNESAQIYKERIETSPVAGTDTIKPESPWYRVIFE